MAVRRTPFERVGGFRTDFGKVGRASRPEDTDLCIRMSAGTEDGCWIYEPKAVVHHHVPADRTTLRFFLRRCYLEGLGKAEMKRHLNEMSTLADEADYVRSVVPSGLRRRLRDIQQAPKRNGAQACAMIAGVGFAGAGFGLSLSALPAFRTESRPPIDSR
jgi:hypothetical protein